MVGLLLIDLALFGVGLWYVLEDLNQWVTVSKVIQITIVGLTFTNLVAYTALACILQKFFRDHYNNRFDSQMKPIRRICYLLLLQSIVEVANESLLLYFSAKNSDSIDLPEFLWSVQETLMPYIGLLLPCFIIFRQHQEVFSKEDHQNRAPSTNQKYINVFVDDVEEEPDFRAELEPVSDKVK